MIQISSALLLALLAGLGDAFSLTAASRRPIVAARAPAPTANFFEDLGKVADCACMGCREMEAS